MADTRAPGDQGPPEGHERQGPQLFDRAGHVAPAEGGHRQLSIPRVVHEHGRAQVRLDEPARAVAPGQSGVLYGIQEQVLGGGVIA